MQARALRYGRITIGLVMCGLMAGILWRLLSDEKPEASPKSPSELTAEQIMQRTAATYRDCRTYQDRGVVKTVFVEDKGTWTVLRPFRTAFVRPDRFRFEFTEKDLVDKELRYIIWRHDMDVKVWWDVDPVVKNEESLSMALGGAAGVSGGSSNTIPNLLMLEEIEDWPLTELTDMQRLDDAKVANADCFRVRGKVLDDSLTVWIDQATFLVRRIDEQTTHQDFRTEDTTTYEPLVNAGVGDDLLRFDPPATQ